MNGALVIAAPIVLLVLASLSTADAQSSASCAEVVEAWAEGCEGLRTECVEAVLCPSHRVVLEAGCVSDARLRVEIAERTSGSFRPVGHLGISPVGHFPDWSAEAPARREVFDRLAACLARDPSVIVASAPANRPRAAFGTRAPVPWRLFVGMALAGIVAWRRWQRVHDRRIAVQLGMLAFATFVARWLLAPVALFHPNGQGPFWIGFALDLAGARSSYGPGYWELFGWLAHLPWATPERTIFAAQAIASALAPGCAWIVTRELGASRCLAWVGAVAVATSPILARIAQSQSYYATWTSLLFFAAAVLVVGMPRGRGTRDFAVAIASAGFLISQAARVTPIGWVAAAVLPLVVACGPRSVRASIVAAAAATFGIGAVVAVTSGSTMLAVLHGGLGTHWLPVASSRFGSSALLGAALSVVPALVATSATVYASAHRASAWLRLAVLGVVLVAMSASCMVGADAAPFVCAFDAMWAPTWIAPVVALVTDLRTQQLRRGATLAGSFAALFVGVATWKAERSVPTNVLESQWAERWRAGLPRGSVVVYVGRLGSNVLAMPLYGPDSAERVVGWSLAIDDPPPERERLGAHAYYYESSLCSAPEARDACRRLRAHLGARWIASRSLPARSSARASFFQTPSVSVALYELPSAPRPR